MMNNFHAHRYFKIIEIMRLCSKVSGSAPMPAIEINWISAEDWKFWCPNRMNLKGFHPPC